jgi:hypothetical protein
MLTAYNPDYSEIALILKLAKPSTLVNQLCHFIRFENFYKEFWQQHCEHIMAPLLTKSTGLSNQEFTANAGQLIKRMSLIKSSS